MWSISAQGVCRALNLLCSPADASFFGSFLLTQDSSRSYDELMSVRTPDPNSGWLGDDELAAIRLRLPLLYVEAVPVRVDGLGRVIDVGLLLRATTSGSITRTIV